MAPREREGKTKLIHQAEMIVTEVFDISELFEIKGELWESIKKKYPKARIAGLIIELEPGQKDKSIIIGPPEEDELPIVISGDTQLAKKIKEFLGLQEETGG